MQGGGELSKLVSLLRFTENVKDGKWDDFAGWAHWGYSLSSQAWARESEWG